MEWLIFTENIGITTGNGVPATYKVTRLPLLI
jgi:hypothetical protein